tara:strand:+ start:82 stop:570 length:489 start_codon:yes stop_codon:yes gene_type:complete
MAKVFLYRNLHKKCWSVKHKGIVIAHADRLFAWDCKFWVSPAGNERVRKEKKKNVHAYVVCEPEDLMVPEGTKVKGDTPLMEFNLLKKMGETNEERITYQPYKMKVFREVESGDPIFESPHAYLSGRGSVWIAKRFKHVYREDEQPKEREIKDSSRPRLKTS